MECNHCKHKTTPEKIRISHYSCPKCGLALRLSSALWVQMIADSGSWKELQALGNIIVGWAKVGSRQMSLAVMEFSSFGGSLNMEAAELLYMNMKRCARKGIPFVFVAASGGARLQEGVQSLYAMGKFASGARLLKKKGVPFIVLLSDPVAGGMLASGASLADITLAEKGAFIGFAGPRVLQSVGEDLGDFKQNAQAAFAFGKVDAVVERAEIRPLLGKLLSYFMPATRCYEAVVGSPVRTGISPLFKWNWQKRAGCQELLRDIGRLVYNSNELNEVNAWEQVMLARDPKKLSGRELIENYFEDFFPFSGDGLFQEDATIVVGLAIRNYKSFLVIATDLKNNFGMGGPAGYRKVLRAVQFANRIGIPIFSFINTPGARACVEAERGGIGHAIAKCLEFQNEIRVPFYSLITGQGGSGGALALTNGKDIYMTETSVFSVITPEGAASILYRDKEGKREAADKLNLTPKILLKQKMIKGVIK